jgi:hypothetical protein
MASKTYVPVYGYINKLCRRQAEVFPIFLNPNVRSAGQGEAMHRKYMRLKLRGGPVYDRPTNGLPSRSV